MTSRTRKGNYLFEALIDGNPSTITVRIDEDTLPPATTASWIPSGVFNVPFDAETPVTLDYLLTVLRRPQQSDHRPGRRGRGRVRGADRNELGIPGIQVQLLSNTDIDADLELIATTFTNPTALHL